jgi:hypothetical protein
MLRPSLGLECAVGETARRDNQPARQLFPDAGSCNLTFTTLWEYTPAGISVADRGNPNASACDHIQQAGAFSLVACFESASGLFRPAPSFVHYAGMMAEMHKQQRPTGLSAGAAFLCAEAWQSGTEFTGGRLSIEPLWG